MAAAEASVSRTALAPLLSVRNGAQAIAFYHSALGATELDEPDGDVDLVAGTSEAPAQESQLPDAADEEKAKLVAGASSGPDGSQLSGPSEAGPGEDQEPSS